MTRPLRLAEDYVSLPNKEKKVLTRDVETLREIEDTFFIIANELKESRLKFDFSRFLGKSESYFSQNESRMKKGGVDNVRIAKTIQNINARYKEFVEAVA